MDRKMDGRLKAGHDERGEGDLNRTAVALTRPSILRPVGEHIHLGNSVAARSLRAEMPESWMAGCRAFAARGRAVGRP
jgi:hypothetical protein